MKYTETHSRRVCCMTSILLEGKICLDLWVALQKIAFTGAESFKFTSRLIGDILSFAESRRD